MGQYHLYRANLTHGVEKHGGGTVVLPRKTDIHAGVGDDDQTKFAAAVVNAQIAGVVGIGFVVDGMDFDGAVIIGRCILDSMYKLIGTEK